MRQTQPGSFRTLPPRLHPAAWSGFSDLVSYAVPPALQTMTVYSYRLGRRILVRSVDISPNMDIHGAICANFCMGVRMACPPTGSQHAWKPTRSRLELIKDICICRGGAARSILLRSVIVCGGDEVRSRMSALEKMFIELADWYQATAIARTPSQHFVSFVLQLPKKRGTSGQLWLNSTHQ